MTDLEKILDAVGVEIEQCRRVLMTIGMAYLGGKGYYLYEIEYDLNAIRELELLVIEKFGAEAYWKELNYEAAGELIGLTQRVTAMITADAATRITAMLAVVEEAGK